MTAQTKQALATAGRTTATTAAQAVLLCVVLRLADAALDAAGNFIRRRRSVRGDDGLE